METKYTKKDANTLIVEEVVPQQVIPEKVKDSVEYTYGFLLKQKADIQKQWNEMIAQKNAEIDGINAARQKELDFVNELIVKADELGITNEVKPIEDKIEL